MTNLRIKRLYIGDFGVFKNQTLDNLNSDIIVIGGFNRAGKSTFLEILRYLGYGIPNGSKLPKPTVQYMIDSDILNEDGCKYNVRLQGYSEPKVTALNNFSETTINELYGNIDFYTYSQLFTITLDELQKVNSKEAERLRTVLMGAGFEEIVQIPSITTELKKDAEKIGGKNGSVNTKLFKPYNQKIIDSIKIKQEEKRKINLYYEKVKDLEVTEQNIINETMELETWENKLFLLDIIKSSIDKYQIKIELQEEVDELKKYNTEEFCKINKTYSVEGLENLRDRYYNIKEKYNEVVYYFKSNILEDISAADILRKVSDKIFNYEKRLPGVKEKLQKYFSLKELYEEEKNKIISECNLVNEEFKGNLNSVLNIKCDDLSQDKLLKLSTMYNSLSNEIKQLDSEIEDINFKRTILEKQVKDIKLNNNGDFIKKYLLISLGIALIGILLSIVNSVAGLSISLVGVVSTALYMVIRYISSNGNEAKNRVLINELKELNIVRESKNLKLSKIDTEFDRVNEEICYYTKQLQLKEDISLEGLRDYLKNIQSLKKDIVILSQRGKKLAELQEEMVNEFKSMEAIVLNLQYLKGMEFDNILSKDDKPNKKGLLDKELEYMDYRYMEYNQYFLSDIEKLIDDCKFLEKYDHILSEKQSLESIIKNILCSKNFDDDIVTMLDNFIYGYKMFIKYIEAKGKLSIITREIHQSFGTDKARMALNSYYFNSDEAVENTTLINKIYNEVSSKELLQSDYEAARIKVEEIQLRLDSEKDKRQYLREEIKRLSTVAKLEMAQREIDQARAELKILAERYAVNNVAAYILDRVQENFIENAKETMLKGASEMFEEITNGEYVNIMPVEDITKNDYAVALEDDNIESSTDFLSRGTAEQLFLSVRLSKLKEIRTALPVILDDPFVNFDSPHVDKVMKILDRLSKTNQIFVLTCHPQMITNIMKCNANAQYYKLEKGKISSSDANKLIEYLSNK